MRIFHFAVGLLLAICVNAQDPVKWSFAGDIGSDSGQVSLTATIDEGWHVYGLTLESDLGPLPTIIEVDSTDLVWNEWLIPEPKTKYDDMFLMNVNYYEEEVTFIGTYTGSTNKVTGFVEFMVCNDEMCLPPTQVPFELSSLADR